MLLTLVIVLFVSLQAVAGNNNTAKPSNQSDDFVRVGPTRIAMPMRRILLVRKGSDYCAIKFNEAFGYGVVKGYPVEAYARYEVYYQGDGTGDFLHKKSEHREIELIIPQRRGFLSTLFGLRENILIECGPNELSWATGGSVHFFRHPDQQDNPITIAKYGIELAPTLWTNINEVDIRDTRLKWYRYDESRAETTISINQLWPANP